MADSTKTETIPRRVLHRMSTYFRYLEYLDESGVDRISSRELAAASGVTASQLRQDLHYFGSFGQQGYGYRVDLLLIRIRKLIGLDRAQTMVLVGAGRLGRALASYGSVSRRGFSLSGAFDADSTVVGMEAGGILVAPIAELPDFLQTSPVDIGIIAVPAPAAQSVVDILVRGGVNAIWNFAPVRLVVPPSVIVEHIHLTDSLVALAFASKLNREVGGVKDAALGPLKPVSPP